MSTEQSVQRLLKLNNILTYKQIYFVRFFTSAGKNEYVSIGNVSKKVNNPNNPALVPIAYLPKDTIPQSILHHLRWMMQKDILGQDMFLIGSPGPFRRWLAMMYLELTLKEVEYVSLSRDTTDSDLKQRREIRQSTSYHIDQCAVRAAIKGRALILEGIEKAERNVLPVLNNLLENREMQLDDGRFLMAAERYDKLLKAHSKQELDKWKLVRVSENFRVIALGLPIPRYIGNPLDPPLRSRFQAREVTELPFQEQMNYLKTIAESEVPTEKLNQILSFASTLRSDESRNLSLPDFPVDNLSKIIKIIKLTDCSDTQRLLGLLYPHDLMLSKEGKIVVLDALKTFDLNDNNESLLSILKITHNLNNNFESSVEIGHKKKLWKFNVKSGTSLNNQISNDFVFINYHETFLSQMILSHSVGDFCIVGPRGSGKSILVNQFAYMLGYNVEHIMLYQDMSARDLLQNRTTTSNGDTIWQASPLVVAALEGSLAILDGVHRVNAGTFSILQRLIHDRELTLFDGTKLIGGKHYDELNSKLNGNKMPNDILRIHDSFRIIALSEPPSSSLQQQWLTSEMLTMFLFHSLKHLSKIDEEEILKKLVGDIDKIQPILQLTHELRESNDDNLKSLSNSLSMRQLLRMAKHLNQYPNDDIYKLIEKACLAKFLPRLTRMSLQEQLERMNIVKKIKNISSNDSDNKFICKVENNQLYIGKTIVNISSITDSETKVPNVLFYENTQHLSIMEDMLKDYMLGQHLLLVGNQGVGKNKIVDKFLQLLNKPREYIQLHRDTTVQTLTIQPVVIDGIVKFQDSPLVNAVKNGYVLVVDEADKAPTSVTCILKTLVENGEMHLSDSRKIVNCQSKLSASDNIIKCHENFRMIVLANRPGFPFLGNDFFAAMGDIFSTHAIDNPDFSSEMEMLKQYGPNVNEVLLKKLVLAFSDLRNMADEGQINYPYSTREVVNMVRHLENFPNEGLSTVVENVLHFDSYNKELKETVIETMHRHGIPIGANPTNVKLAKSIQLPNFSHVGILELEKCDKASITMEDDSFGTKMVSGINIQSYPIQRTDARSILFTDQEAYWTLPLHETSAVIDVTYEKSVLQNNKIEDILHIVTTNPICLYSMNTSRQHLTCIDLYNFFPTSRSIRFKPKITLKSINIKNNILLHEQSTDTILLINYARGNICKIDLENWGEKLLDKTFRSKQGVFRMCADFANETNQAIFYKQNANFIKFVDLLHGKATKLIFNNGIHVNNVFQLSTNDWMIIDMENDNRYLLNKKTNEFKLFIYQESENKELKQIFSSMDMVDSANIHKSHLSHILNENIDSCNRIISNSLSYATIAVGLPDLLSIDVFTIPKPKEEYSLKPISSPVLCLNDSSQIVRVLPTSRVPETCKVDGQIFRYLSGYLEIVDLLNKTVRYLPIPAVSNSNVFNQWFIRDSDVDIVACKMSNDNIATIDGGGCIRIWQASLEQLNSSLNFWRSMMSTNLDKSGHLELKREDKELDFNGPKHGRIDPSNSPHIGGNQWAGGTGGRDTAGLGGVGGPYRLDSGHDVHQVSDWQKSQVPPEVLAAAREMGLKAWKQRLKDIKMSEYDGEMYEKYSSSVSKQVQLLKNLVNNLQAKRKERQWLKHQSYGDLDETKLIEGLVGERSIYKRRGEKHPEEGSPQEKPKLLRLVVDLSGSMYRFNGYDGRLERMLETMLMVMEALENNKEKIVYEIIAHSGEGPDFPIVKHDKPPLNNKERLNVLKTMHAHSQFCISGDHTLEATETAIKTIQDNLEADEYFVVVFSDANLDRYGIRGKHLNGVLTSNDNVNAYIIFLGSLGNQAQSLIKQVPVGKGFLCLESQQLPGILKEIFASTVLAS